MTSGKLSSGSYRLLRHALLLLPMAMATLAAVGCAPLSKNRARVSVQRYPSGAEKSPVAAARGNASSLAPIINEKIQRGYYAEGERALRQYLVEHPGDGAAQAMLHQLTVDPTQMLGYNGSRNPSDLRLGQTLRMPLSKPGAGAVVSDTSPTSETAAPQTEVITDASPSEKARLLQDESVVLFKEGRKQDALERLDHALLIQPNLKSNGAIASSLRKQLVANYHEQAVVLYRDQKLDSAIALWDRVLAIDPGFEPAVIYRTRALELKQRLKQF
jgi:tetratricopeptide (TPR) repeat protein